MLIHIFDRHGQLVKTDALPGSHVWANGTGIDGRGDVYFLNASPMVVHGERYFNDHGGTLIKFTPGRARLLTAHNDNAPVPLNDKPDRPLDLYKPGVWVQGAQWLHPGVGWNCNYSTACSCWNCRFALDIYGRSFTPETDRYSVGVLDTAGNLILRFGRYGNVDDGLPLVREGGPSEPRSIGGDETAFMHAPYLAVHTDNRVFAADPGNARIVSVKLGYYTDRKVPLKKVSGRRRRR